MLISPHWLKYLLYLELSATHPADFTTAHAYAMKSGSAINFCNRVMADTAVTADEVDAIIDYYGSTAFRWFVDQNDQRQIQLLESNGFTYQGFHAAMRCDLTHLPALRYQADLQIDEIFSGDDLQAWLSIAGQSMECDADELGIFVAYLMQHATPGTVHLYLARYHGIPVATSMLIQRQEVASLHCVGTLPVYRGKGIGYAISHVPLMAAQTRGATTAILLASDMGKPIYEKIGFVSYGIYNKYERASA